MISIPLSAYAGDARMRGTHVCRNLSSPANPPGPPSAHVASCPSLHRSGVTNENVAVVDAWARSAGRLERGTSSAAHAGRSMIEWKYTYGLCLAAYWSVALA